MAIGTLASIGIAPVRAAGVDRSSALAPVGTQPSLGGGELP